MPESICRLTKQLGVKVNLKIDNSEIDEMLTEFSVGSGANVAANEISLMKPHELRGGSCDDVD